MRLQRLSREGSLLIVGLGNPGTQYAKTRHNLGSMVLKALAEKEELTLKRKWRMKGKIAQCCLDGKNIYLLLPTTYMNLSGEAVRKILDTYHLLVQNVLVVADDIYLKLGTMRLREKGSSGGHKGLKNIEEHLGTQEFARLRLGVGGASLSSNLEAYVLGNFNAEETKLLGGVIEDAISVIRRWITQGVKSAAQLAGELSSRSS